MRTTRIAAWSISEISHGFNTLAELASRALQHHGTQLALSAGAGALFAAILFARIRKQAIIDKDGDGSTQIAVAKHHEFRMLDMLDFKTIAIGER